MADEVLKRDANRVPVSGAITNSSEEIVNLRVDDSTKRLLVDIGGDPGAMADGTANPTVSGMASFISGFNGTTWDRIRTAVTTVSATLTGFLNTLPWAVFHTTPTTRTNGQGGPLEADNAGSLLNRETYAPVAEDNTNGVIATVDKPLAASTYCWSVDQSAALEASSVVKAAAGVIRHISGRIDSTAATATYYVQVLNAASLPADGAVTLLCAPTKIQHTTGTDTPFNLDFLDQGLYASTGLVVCLSSTEFTKTIGGAYLSMTIRYI